MDLSNGLDPLYYNHLYPPNVALPPILIPNANDFIGVANPTFDSGAGRPFSSAKVREYEVKYKVGVKDKKHANAMCVVRCPGCPLPYSPYISTDGWNVDPCAYAIDIRADPLESDDWQWWVVTARFSTEMPEEGANFLTQWPTSLTGPQNNPWMERPKFRTEIEETTEAQEFDLDGNPYVSSSGQPFTPPYVHPVKRVVWVFERNMPTYMVTPANINRYNDVVNDRLFLGQPAECVYCTWLPGELLFRGKIPYYRTTIRFKFEDREFYDPNTKSAANPIGTLVRRTWQPYILDQGTERLMTLFGHPLKNTSVPITKFGQPVTQPVLLDGNGGELKPDTDGKLYPRYRRFRNFEKRDLSFLFLNMGP